MQKRHVLQEGLQGMHCDFIICTPEIQLTRTDPATDVWIPFFTTG